MIGQVSKKTGLSTKAIRFYETASIIAPTARKENDYRLFNERDIQRLMLVKRARELGLPLEDVRKVVSLCIEKGCDEARDYIAKNVPRYIQQIETKIQNLHALKQEFEYMLNAYEQADHAWHHKTNDCCDILPIRKGRI